MAKKKSKPVSLPICPACKRELAKLDRRRRRDQQLVPATGVMRKEKLNQAPVWICPCGHVLIEVTGTLL